MSILILTPHHWWLRFQSCEHATQPEIRRLERGPLPVLLTSHSSDGPGASLNDPARLETLLLASAKLSSSLRELPARAGARAMKDGEEGSCPASKNSSPSLSTTPVHGQRTHCTSASDDRLMVMEQPPVIQMRGAFWHS